jgi:cytochrome P450/NADPH-cytochrome P450 reductase
VGYVAFTTPSGRQHKGAASATIAATPVGGKLLGSVRRLSSSFRLPKDPSVPVIMIGPGEERRGYMDGCGLVLAIQQLQDA